MKQLQFTPVGVIQLHLEESGDVVVRGDANREAAILDSPQTNDTDISPVEIKEDSTLIRCRGSVTLRLPAGTSMNILGVADDMVLRNLGDVSVAECKGDLVGSELASLELAGDVRGDVALRKIKDQVQLQNVRGDLAVAHVSTIKSEAIHGDTSISNVPEVNITCIGADLSAAHCNTLQIKSVQGDVALSSVIDVASVQSTGGDVTVSSPGQSLALTGVGGDVTMNGPLHSQGKYWISAGGDVVGRISGDIRVTIRAGGEIRGAPDLSLAVQEDGSVTGILGNESEACELSIEAGGDVILNSPGQWQRRHSAIVDAELKKAMKEVKTELKKAAGGVKAETKRANVDVTVDLDDLEKIGTTGASVREIVRDLLDSLAPNTPATAVAQAKPVTSKALGADELRMVLEMLEAGTITAEEAEQLMKALTDAS